MISIVMMITVNKSTKKWNENRSSLVFDALILKLHEYVIHGIQTFDV